MTQVTFNIVPFPNNKQFNSIWISRYPVWLPSTSNTLEKFQLDRVVLTFVYFTQAFFAFDTFPRWNEVLNLQNSNWQHSYQKILIIKNCFPLCPNHSKAHTHQPRWQAALKRASSLLLVDNLMTCPGQVQIVLLPAIPPHLGMICSYSPANSVV